MDRINDQAAERLKGVVLGDVKAFVRGKINQIRNDANRMYQISHPGDTLDEATIAEIAGDLESRLESAVQGRLVPEINTNRLSPSGTWSQRLLLLAGIARFPRKCFSSKFFLQGIGIDPERLISVMNVLGDRFLASGSGQWAMQRRAGQELLLIEQIMNSPDKEQRKCARLMDLLDGKTVEGN